MINAIGKKDGVIGKIDSANSLFYAPYASPRARRYPLSYVYSGNYEWNNGGVYSQGTYGYWWTSAAADSDLAYRFAIASGGPYYQPGSDRLNGFTLR